ncbi:multiple sugar transport system substrate-binding protein [Paenibacillus phyllosphaerae]|uniref:Multiple sugar transport system substrate-binding protein n=1 Tax=Paenibacillus phyllosphaerae TaxID=274593 RepID=A0A7W5AZL4_9BACL|nr:extracellular solute-binding protein [Paenibacillus phyllosphaerae]MBB3111697.1 multiple sugar transport system substrate-binding protein [Paenibacillus phyllosphaerae]
MRRRSTLITLAAALMLTFTMSACSNGGGNAGTNNTPTNEGATPAVTNSGKEGAGEGSAGDSEEDITLRLMWWGSQTRHDLTNEVVKLYESKNPHVNIETEFTSFDGYWEKLAAMVAGNNMPDVLQMNFGEYMTQYASKDVLLDMKPFTENGTIDVSKANEGIMASGIANGQLLGIPLGMNALTVIYDEQMLQDAGVAAPDMNWTWDDWKKAAETVYAKTGNYGTQGLEITNIFEYYARQHGQKMYSEDGKGLGFDDKLLAEYLAMTLEQQEKKTYPSMDVIMQHEAIEDQLIVHGKAPFDFRWSNQVVALTKAANRTLKLAPLPGPDSSKGMYLKPSLFFSISKKSKHQEEAAKFIDYFINDVEANKIMMGERGVPITSTIRETLAADLDETNKMIFDYIDRIGENSSPIDSVYPAGASEISKAMEEIHEQVMYKQLTPEEAAAEFRKRAEEIIARGAE